MTAVTAEPTPLDDIRKRAGEIRAHDRRTRRELLELRRERLRSLLRHAVRHSPYYREASASTPPKPTLPSCRHSRSRY